MQQTIDLNSWSRNLVPYCREGKTLMVAIFHHNSCVFLDTMAAERGGCKFLSVTSKVTCFRQFELFQNQWGPKDNNIKFVLSENKCPHLETGRYQACLHRTFLLKLRS